MLFKGTYQRIRNRKNLPFIFQKEQVFLMKLVLIILPDKFTVQHGVSGIYLQQV